ncbi:hypothetical protein CsSME_00007562 [Camellia sinensis var. sinensis]
MSVAGTCSSMVSCFKSLFFHGCHFPDYVSSPVSSWGSRGQRPLAGSGQRPRNKKQKCSQSCLFA